MRAQELGSGKLVIFDIDDTLVNTDTKVNVVRDGQVVKQLNSHDFTHYKLDYVDHVDEEAAAYLYAGSQLKLVFGVDAKDLVRAFRDLDTK